MRLFSILIFTISLVYSSTTIFVSGYDIENGYLEIKMINEEPIVGFQFLISTSSELEAEFGTEILNMEGQTITLTGYEFEYQCSDPQITDIETCIDSENYWNCFNPQYTDIEECIGSGNSLVYCDNLCDSDNFTNGVSAVESNFSIFGDENGLIIGFSMNTGSLEGIPEADDFENGKVLIRIPWTFNELNGGTVGIDNPKFITPGISGGPPLYVEPIAGENFNIEPLSIDRKNLPKTFELGEAYPNPFNPKTLIEYSIPVQSFVELNVYDINGRHIRSLVNTMALPGRYKAVWNGVDDFGNEASSGLYIYQLIGENVVLSDKIMLIK